MSCRFELTVICDNHAKKELLSEHGLSFYILADGLTILFDTGSGETLLPNAMKLGIDLAKCSHLVLSHGHYDHTGGPFYLDETGQFADLIPDDQALWINTPQGLVVILGCCHSGVSNTVEYIRQLNDGVSVAGIIGGLHLLHASAERLEQTIIYLKKLKPQFIYAGHCTGDDVIVMLREHLRDTAVGQFHAGMHIGAGERTSLIGNIR